MVCSAVVWRQFPVVCLSASRSTAANCRRGPKERRRCQIRDACSSSSGAARGLSQRQHRRRRLRQQQHGICNAAPDDLPSSTAAVADWAALSFKDAASNGNLTKACLLVALEEEAAAQAAYAAAEGMEATADALRGCVSVARLLPPFCMIAHRMSSSSPGHCQTASPCWPPRALCPAGELAPAPTPQERGQRLHLEP